ncbi:MAG: hypothetical protein PWQ77_1250 [Kosmotogales bacterium]|nr:hypothetical protein [Kosmotogales bacterium]
MRDVKKNDLYIVRNLKTVRGEEMGSVLTMGEILVEIMRPERNISLASPGYFKGPYPSGAPAIFIDSVARLGENATIIGGIGDDEFGKNVFKRLKDDGVNCDLININKDRPTAVAFVGYDKTGGRKFIFHVKDTSAVFLKKYNNDELKHQDYFHIMGCSLMVQKDFRNKIIKLTNYLYKRGTKISFDPNIRRELLLDENINEVVDPILKNCEILFPGVDELLFITNANTVNEALKKIFENFPVKMVVLKLGKEGCRVITEHDDIPIKAYKIVETDPTGAGDCFDAGFITALLKGKSLEEAGKIAAAAGAINATEFGPMEGLVTKEKIKELSGISL